MGLIEGRERRDEFLSLKSCGIVSGRSGSNAGASPEMTTRNLSELTEMGALERKGQHSYARCCVMFG